MLKLRFLRKDIAMQNQEQSVSKKRAPSKLSDRGVAIMFLRYGFVPLDKFSCLAATVLINAMSKYFTDKHSFFFFFSLFHILSFSFDFSSFILSLIFEWISCWNIFELANSFTSNHNSCNSWFQNSLKNKVALHHLYQGICWEPDTMRYELQGAIW